MCMCNLSSKITEVLSDDEEEGGGGETVSSRKRSRTSSSSSRSALTALQEANLGRKNAEKKYLRRIESLEKANESKVRKMKMLMTEIKDLRLAVARHESDLRKSENTGAHARSDLDKTIIRLRDELASTSDAKTRAIKEVHMLRQKIERGTFEKDVQYRRKVATLQDRLAEAEEEIEKRNEGSALEQCTETDRLRRDLADMKRRAEDAEARVANQRASQALREKHAVVVSTMEKRERALVLKLERLEAQLSDARLASVRLASTEATNERLKLSNADLSRSLAEFPEYRRKCDEWTKVMRDVLASSARSVVDSSAGTTTTKTNSPPRVVTPALVASHVRALQEKIAIVLHSRGDAEVSESSARRARDEAERRVEDLRAQLETEKEKVKNEQEIARNARIAEATLKKDIESIERLVAFYRKATDPSGKITSSEECGVLRSRISSLEQLLEKQRDIATEASRAARESREALVAASSSASQTTGGTKVTKVLHFRLNPATLAHKAQKKRERAELDALRKEVAALRKATGTPSKSVATPASALASTPASTLAVPPFSTSLDATSSLG
eukprot:g5172.t1